MLIVLILQLVKLARIDTRCISVVAKIISLG